MSMIKVLVSICFTFRNNLSSLLNREAGALQRRGRNGAIVYRRLTMAWICALLFVLASCGGSTPAPTVQITPLTFPAGTNTSTVGRITPPVRATATLSVASNDNWTMYHFNNARSGYVAGTPDPQKLANLWNKQLDGAVYAEPLVVNSLVIVATENDTIYGLNPQTGSVQWKTNVGTPVPHSSLPCGDIDPLGITGTPVYDPQTGLVFAVAEISGPAHILVGVDATTGTLKVRRLADLPDQDPQVEQERGALALYNGRVYIPYGGLDGDCGDYHGGVVASLTDGTGSLLSYKVPTPREAGIWSTPGPVIDSQGNLYVSVGNGAVTQGNWDHSDSILRFSPTLTLEDAFAPTSWGSDNASDLDLGSMGPVLLPGNRVYADGKSSQGYLLRADHLGGVGGQIQTLSVCGAFGGSAVVGQSAYVPCTDGVRQLTLSSDGSHIVKGWHASSAIKGSPVVGGNTLYSMDAADGVLYALNITTGNIRTQVSVGQASRFATPTIWQKTVFVGTLSGIVAVTIS